MGYGLGANVREHSKHDGNAYFVLRELAIAGDDFDRTVTLYMDTLAAYCHMEIRALQRAIQHLESSGELVVYAGKNWRQACTFQIRVLPIEWPESYRIHGELIDRRQRPVWTPELEEQRQEIHRHNEAKIRKQRAENRRSKRNKEQK